MPRYSLNLRSKYGQNEPTGGERIQAGIGGAIQDYMQYQEGQRQERNDVAARGGTPMDEQPSGPMDRLRTMGRRVKGMFGAGDGDGPDAESPFEQQTETGYGAGGQRTQPVQASTQSAPMNFQYTPSGPPIDVMDRMARPGMQPGQRPYAAMPPTQNNQLGNTVTPGAPGSPGGQRGQMPVQQGGPVQQPSAPARSISDAIKPIIYEGRGGQKYNIDPMYQQRVGIAGHEMEADAADTRRIAEEGRKEARTTQTQNEQIASLTAAGMPAAEARARVLTGTVRYDETFGQQFRPNTQMTFEQRRTLQTQRDGAAYTRAQLFAAGKQNTDEFRRATLALQAAELALHAADTQAAGFERTATAAEGSIPKDPITRSIAETQPGGKEAITSAESTAAANRDSARNARARGSAAATTAAGGVTTGAAAPRGGAAPRDDTGTGGRGASRFTSEQAQSRALALKGAGKSAAEVYTIMRREGYNVKPPKGAAVDSGGDDINLRTR